MRSFVFLSFLALASADSDLEKKGKCVVDGGEAASDLLDAALFIWGAKQRCGDVGKGVKCEIDIASAVQSISSMIGTILKAVDRCGHDFDGDCGRAATRLTKSIAEMSSANGGIKQKCAANWQQPDLSSVSWAHGGWALCVLDIKNTAKNFLKAIKALLSIEDKCDDGRRKCASNSLKVAGALAGLGEYLAASIGDCEPPSNMAHDAECAQESIMIVHSLMKVSEAGIEISKKCKEEDRVARLYTDDGKAEGGSSSVTLALAALLPISAVLAFVAGSRFAKARVQTTRDLESFVPVQE